MTDEAMQLLAERVANFEGSCYASDAVNDRLSLAQGYLALTDRLTAVEAERDQLRQWMWLTHGCAVAMLYGDDGQMQCSACMIDFKAWPVEDVLNRLRQRRAVALGVPLSLSAIAARIHEDESSD